jgi:hypothetical protein
MGEYVNSRQVRFDKSPVSCGVLEVHHLPDQSATQTTFAIANHLYHKANGRPAAFVLFSDVVTGDSRGERLAAQIGALEAGDLFESVRQVNPKTGNVIRVWVWTINHDRFREWYKEEYVNRVSEEA